MKDTEIEQMLKNKLVTTTVAAKLLGLSKQKLREAPEDWIKPIFTPGGLRRYKLNDIKKILGEPVEE